MRAIHQIILVLAALQVVFIYGQLLPGPKSFEGHMRKCQWIGDAPLCGKPTCTFGWHQVDRNKYGDGRRCWTGKKVLCCENSTPGHGHTTPRWTTGRTTTRRPYARPSVSPNPYYTPTPAWSPNRIPVNSPTDNAHNGQGYGNNHWRTIPITIEKSDDVRPVPVTARPTPPMIPSATVTPTPKTKANSRKEDILAFLKSLDDLP